jgi:toxin-antitoxin system PIN domain toxin
VSVLLDVNVLVALAWPNHVHHRLARSWFQKNRGEGWATCSITENGFVRVSSNPKVVDEARTPAEAVSMLRSLVALDKHRFLEDDVSFARADPGEVERIRGYRQVMDAHLIRLAGRHGCRLATFDRKVIALLPRAADRDRQVLVLS